MADTLVANETELTTLAGTENVYVSDGADKRATVSTIRGGASQTELGRLVGVTSAIQTQIDRHRHVVKQADEVISSDSTLSNDAELSLSVLANTVYYVRLRLFVQNGSATPNFKYTFSVPSGASMRVSNTSPIGTTANAANDIIATPFSPTINSTTERYVGVEGYLYVGATAGTLYVQWAQNTSDAATTTIKKGSVLEVFK